MGNALNHFYRTLIKILQKIKKLRKNKINKNFENNINFEKKNGNS